MIDKLHANFVNPFLSAGCYVIENETGVKVSRGVLEVQRLRFTTDEVTVLIGVTGKVAGVVMYALSERTAKALVRAMLGEPCVLFDEMAESAIAELGNMIAGRATVDLEANGFGCAISPPTVLVGRGTIISTVNIEALLIPLSTEIGDVRILVALNKAAADRAGAASRRPAAVGTPSGGAGGSG